MWLTQLPAAGQAWNIAAVGETRGGRTEPVTHVRGAFPKGNGLDPPTCTVKGSASGGLRQLEHAPKPLRLSRRCIIGGCGNGGTLCG